MTERQPFTPKSLLEMRGTSDPQIAPDGEQVVYVEHWIETITKDGKTRPGYRTALMLSSGPGAAPQRLTWPATGGDRHPRWSPDGQRLAFLSTRHDDTPQLFVLDLAGGEARPLTSAATLSEGVDSFDWHPDGAALCFVSSGHVDGETKTINDEHDERVYVDRLPFKFDGAGLYDERRAQLWQVGTDGTGLTQLTDTGFNLSQPRWSPDGTAIAFASIDRRELEWTFVDDLFIYNVADRSVRRLTPSQGTLTAYAWSPDSAQLAFLGHDNRRGNASNNRVWRIDRTGEALQCLTDSFDRSADVTTMSDMHFLTVSGRVVWRDDRLWFPATDHGTTGLYSVPAAGGAVTQIATGGLSVAQFSIGNGGIAFTGETSIRTPEVYTVTTAGQDLQRRSHAGDTAAERFALSAPEHLTFSGAGGLEIEGWVIRPTDDAADGARHPLIIYIHGGPHADYGSGFFHEFQVLAAAGYGVLFINPRGGQSYGEEFADLVRGHFGEQDYEDVMLAADLATSWDWVDPARLGVMGGSYGGYLTNWIITHTDRFAAACTQRSISNLVSFAGTSDIGPEFARDEFGALPWTDEEFLMAKSPLRYVKAAKTPTLILHQEEDHRCPMEQAEQLYTALVCLGVPTKFVRFPGEGHDLLRTGQPRRRINRLHHIIDWFDRYLKPAEA